MSCSSRNRAAQAPFTGLVTEQAGEVGSGLVGSRIVHKLRALGAKPLAVGRLDAYGGSLYSSVFGISPGDPDVVAGDITDAALMNDLLSRSDYVIHAAALADVAECTRNPAAALEANIPVPRPCWMPRPGTAAR